MTVAAQAAPEPEDTTPEPLTRLRARLASVVAIPVPPFTPEGAFDRDGHTAVIRRLIDHGVQAVTPNGNTGEFYALSDAEKRQAVEATVAAVDGRAEVMAGVGLDVPSAVAAAQQNT